MSSVAFVASRLTSHDGVSVELGKWAGAFASLGFDVITVAGSGPADRLVSGLDLAANADNCQPPDVDALDKALSDADLVVVENLCSLPLNEAAADTVAEALRGRPAILHHHDLAWQRPHLAHLGGYPPDDPTWAHVTINHRSRHELAKRGIPATTIHNCFDTDTAGGDRQGTRVALGIAPGDRVLLHPTRAIARKNVPRALALAQMLGAIYWLLGPAEDGYGPELEALLAATPVPVLRGSPVGVSLADVFAACDAVTLPSHWEGFGNATVESAIYRRPLAIGAYPVAAEIAAYGFSWFPADNAKPLADWLDEPDSKLLDHNQEVARRHLSLANLGQQLADLLEARGWGL